MANDDKGGKSSKSQMGFKGQEGVKRGKGLKGAKRGKSGAAEAFEDLHVYQRARELTNAVYAEMTCPTDGGRRNRYD